jgi:hypothetical protein
MIPTHGPIERNLQLWQFLCLPNFSHKLGWVGSPKPRRTKDMFRKQGTKQWLLWKVRWRGKHLQYTLSVMRTWPHSVYSNRKVYFTRTFTYCITIVIDQLTSYLMCLAQDSSLQQTGKILNCWWKLGQDSNWGKGDKSKKEQSFLLWIITYDRWPSPLSSMYRRPREATVEGMPWKMRRIEFWIFILTDTCVILGKDFNPSEPYFLYLWPDDFSVSF